MGSSAFIPEDLLLSCILKNWKAFTLDGLKQRKLIFLCNMAWFQYKLRNQVIWPEDETLSYNTILQLDSFSRQNCTWTKVAYAQAFMILYQDPVK